MIVWRWTKCWRGFELNVAAGKFLALGGGIGMGYCPRFKAQVLLGCFYIKLEYVSE